MKLSTKIIAVTSLVIVPVTIGIVYASFTLTHEVVLKKVTEAQTKTAAETMDKIDRTLNEYYKNIRLIGEMSSIQNLLIDTDGTHSHGEHEHREFAKLLNLTGPWEELIVINTDNRIEIKTGSKESDIPIPPSRLLAETVAEARQGAVAYSEAVKDETGTTMLFAAPIRNSSEPGRPLLGVIVGRVAMPTITEILTELEAAVALYNRNDVIIGLAKNKNPDTTFETLQTILGENKTEQIQTNTRLINGILYTFVQQPGYTEYRGSDWTLVLASPEHIITSEANQSAFRIATILALAMIVVLTLLVAFLQQLVIKPAKQLTQTVQEITKGNLSKRVTVGSKDEIGQLGAAFNNMTAQLESSYKELDTKVQERTSELEEKVDELERLNQVMVGRELRMVELKKEINKLKTQTGAGSDASDKE